MARVGQIITNPVSGEQIEFVETAASTNGERLVINLVLAADGKVPGMHVHPKQEERFEVIAGKMEFRMGLKKIEAGPGRRRHRPEGQGPQVRQRRRHDRRGPGNRHPGASDGAPLRDHRRPGPRGPCHLQRDAQAARPGALRQGVRRRGPRTGKPRCPAASDALPARGHRPPAWPRRALRAAGAAAPAGDRLVRAETPGRSRPPRAPRGPRRVQGAGQGMRIRSRNPGASGECAAK